MSGATTILAGRWADAMGAALLSAVWQGVLLVAAVALLLRLVPGLSASVRGRLWLVVLAVLVALPGVEMLLPVHAGAISGGVRVAEGWSVALVAAWAVLMLARGVQLVASAVRLSRIAREAHTVEVPAGVQALLGDGVRVCVSEEAGRPSVVGWRRPRILLPPAMWAAMSEAELRQVVLHEMEHVRRGDQWTNLLQKAAVAAMPLSPAAMWVERRLCLERELACDDGVLRVGAGRKAYAACLARLAEFSVLRRGAVLALGAWERQSELARRVGRLLRGPEVTISAGRRRLAVTAVAGCVLVGGAGLANAPRLVQFGPASTEMAGAATINMAPERHMVAATARVGGIGTGAHMVLASATMPKAVRSMTALAAVKTARADRLRGIAAIGTKRRVARPGLAAVRSVDMVARRPRVEQGWVVLTSFEESVRARPAVVPLMAVAVEAEFSPSYAAVPVEDGWLVVQL